MPSLASRAMAYRVRCTAKGPPGETLLPVDDDYCHSMASLPFMSVLPTRRFGIVKTENYNYLVFGKATLYPRCSCLFSVWISSLEESFEVFLCHLEILLLCRFEDLKKTNRLTIQARCKV